MSIVRAFISAVTKAYVRAVIPVSGLNPLARGNTVGYITVIADEYETNSGATTYTVGASGDYATINLAYAAASAGDIIEIIDDETTLSARLTLTKTIDANGKSIKIKGKSTKSTMILKDDYYPLLCQTEGGSIEFENIIFTEPTNTVGNIFRSTNNSTGFFHFINCEIGIGVASPFYLYNCKESVFDNVDFGLVGIQNPFDNLLSTQARCIINNCRKNTNNNGDNLVSLAPTDLAYYYNYVSVTNSDITTKASCINVVNAKSIRIEGNYLHSINTSTIFTGKEANAASISDISEWDAVTLYSENTLVTYLGILYMCLTENIDTTPNQDINPNWQRARLTTGTIKNNTIYRTTYGPLTHGVFLGFGTYNFVIENNIFDNYWYTVVVKGHDNTIRYNGFGRGPVSSLLIYSNEQLEVRNNTFTSGGYFTYGPQYLNCVGPSKTTFRDNIFFSSGVNNIILELTSRYIDYNVVENIWINNSYFGEIADVSIGGTTYSLHTTEGFTEFEAFVGETNGVFINPEFIGVDPLVEAYYKPTNPLYLRTKDSLGQSIGAVCLIK